LNNKHTSLDTIKAVVFDFDGVLTNNLVTLDQNGNESVTCSRSDGLAFDVFRKLQKSVYILSTETNPVVTVRANKLKVEVLQGINNKADTIRKLADKEGFDLKNILYVGNDLNDYHAMQLCGYTACPADSHKMIKSIATIVLKTKGGYGIARELLEDVFQLDFLQLLYPT
jgi:3-deoxy-D-manno-octulosonate 8-phosphate phosphatase (KDO 8-P phosphatase)